LAGGVRRLRAVAVGGACGDRERKSLGVNGSRMKVPDWIYERVVRMYGVRTGFFGVDSAGILSNK